MRTSRLSFLVPVTSLALSLSVIAGCDDETSGLNGDIDPATAAALVDGIIDGLGNDNESLGALIGGLGDLITDLTSIQDPPPLSADAVPQLIPSALLGSTCAWDFTGSSWFDDTSRTGAPEDGIRFVLYRVDAMGMPMSAGEEFGDIDIRDFTSGDNIDVDITAREASTTVMDYGVGGTLGQSSYNLTSSGFVSDGTANRDFDVSVTGSAAGSNVSMSLQVGTYDITLGSTSDASGFTNMGSIVETASGSSLAIELIFDFESGVDPSSGVELNGVKVAEFTSDERLVAVEGSGLTAAELSLLEGLYDGLGEVFDLVGYLFLFGLDNTGRTLPIG
ncbi:MAG: hypothetical protein GTO46_07585 [Gemmatimonadetes bacterium]|nr:hypothetical protein [Gemmatimonadota bacterium]NIO31493.1 hypothetical protein [Gemmatimonadota bacterium]